MKTLIDKTIVGFDPGTTTGFYKAKLELNNNNIVLGEHIEHGEIHNSMPDFESRILNLIRDVDKVVIERAVMTGVMNRDKVTQLMVTERIIAIIEIYGEILADKSKILIEKLHPETKKLCNNVPNEIKGGHARDAYRILAAHLRISGRVSL